MTIQSLAAGICGVIACALLAGSALAGDAHYDPVGKRDPFRPHETRTKDPCTPKTPLRCYDLEQLRLTAVISGIADSRAMLETPDGKGHVVAKGDPVGRNGGRVRLIRADEIVVVEPSGKLSHEVVLTLREEEE